MNEIDEKTFRKAIRATHGADAQLVRRERVVERFEGETVWVGRGTGIQAPGPPRGVSVLRLGGGRTGDGRARGAAGQIGGGRGKGVDHGR